MGHAGTISFATVAALVSSGSAQIVFENGIANTIDGPESQRVVVRDSLSGAPTSLELLAGADVGAEPEDSIRVEGASSLVINGGRVQQDVILFDNSMFTMNAGEILDDADFMGSAIGVFNGGFLADDLEVFGNAVVSIFGGSFGEDIEAINGGTIEIFGGDFATRGLAEQDNGIAAVNGALITIWGTDFAIDGEQVGFGEIAAITGVLTGRLQDGSDLESRISRNTFGGGPIGRIVLVPTPASIGLFGIAGTLATVRRRR